MAVVINNKEVAESWRCFFGAFFMLDLRVKRLFSLGDNFVRVGWWWFMGLVM